MKINLRGLFVLLASTFLMACGADKPLKSETYLLSQSQAQKNLLIYLPGRQSDLTDYKQQGLADKLLKSALPVDAVSVNATFPYYMARTLLTRLDKDIFEKPEISGYQNYWFIGNSMGALGSFLYAEQHPGKIKGIILLGPFLGEGEVPEEIMKSGGLLKWKSMKPAGQDYVRDIWVYIQKCVMDKTQVYPELVFLSGKDDRYNKIQGILADVLPAGHIFWAAGGHDWDAWSVAFSDFLNSSLAKKLFPDQK